MLQKAGDMILGEEQRKHADWFRESESVLKPLLERRNRLYMTWLNNRQESDQ